MVVYIIAGILFLVIIVLWSRKGTRLIHRHAAKGNYKSVEKLLERKPWLLNIRDFWGLTPIQYAAAYGQVDVIKNLIDRGADLQGGFGWSPLQYAVNSRSIPAILCFLNLKLGPEVEALLLAVSLKDIKIVELLLKSGISAGETDKMGNSSLHAAAFVGSLELAKFLVMYGADPSAINLHGQSAGSIAEQKGFFELARFLNSGKS